MKTSPIRAILVALMCFSLSACHKAEGQHHEVHHTIVVTSPHEKDVVTTQEYVCQIHSRRHIEICALEGGYLEEIPIREGQRVKQGDLMFKILPTLYQAELASDVAEAELARIELNNTRKLFAERVGGRPVVAQSEVAMAEAKLAKVEAKVTLARARLNFANIKAPFNGIIDRLHEQQGSLIEEGDVLTTLSDNDVMWVYFNVPEARYLEYASELDQGEPGGPMATAAQTIGTAGARVNADATECSPLHTIGYFQPTAKLDDAAVNTIDETAGVEANEANEEGKDDEDVDDADEDDDAEETENERDERLGSRQIELMLANGQTFSYAGKIGAIEADFNNETGNIAFRADFPNPNGVLRHGQTGTILIHRVLEDALVIPQRATFEILDKRYVFVVDKDGVVHQHEIAIQDVKEDVFVIGEGLDDEDKIILDGIRQVHDGEIVETEYRDPEEVLANLKTHAE